MFCACFLNMRACSLSPFCKERRRFFFPDLSSFSVKMPICTGVPAKVSTQHRDAASSRDRLGVRARDAGRRSGARLRAHMGFVVSIFAGSLACFSLMFFRFCLFRRFFFRLLLMCFRFMENPAIDPIFFPILLGARRLGSPPGGLRTCSRHSRKFAEKVKEKKPPRLAPWREPQHARAPDTASYDGVCCPRTPTTTRAADPVRHNGVVHLALLPRRAGLCHLLALCAEARLTGAFAEEGRAGVAGRKSSPLGCGRSTHAAGKSLCRPGCMPGAFDCGRLGRGRRRGVASGAE